MGVGDQHMEACRTSPPAEGHRAEERGHQPPPSAGRKGRAEKKAAQLTRKGMPAGRKPQEGEVVSPTGAAGKKHPIKAELQPLGLGREGSPPDEGGKNSFRCAVTHVWSWAVVEEVGGGELGE